MTVEIKITHNMANIDAVSAVHTALYYAAWKPTKSQKLHMLRSVDNEKMHVEVVDLNPDEKTHDRQFEVKLLEDK